MIARFSTSSIALVALLAAPAAAQDMRELDSHEHGVSTLEVAIEGGVIEMNLTSPGVDIVGFEYVATSAGDKDAVESAVRRMLRPEEIVTLPDDAGCRVTGVLARLLDGEDDRAGEEHGAAHHDDEDHAGEDHADGDDHAEAERAEGDSHSAFYARYIYACDNPAALTRIDLPFFAAFPNAAEIEAQYVTDTGAGSAEIGRDSATLALQ